MSRQRACEREPRTWSPVSAAVLAGGESRRFGRDKARAVLGDRTLIAHVLEPLGGLFDEIIIVARKPVSYESFDLQVVADLRSGCGSLGGLWTALVHARHDHCFVVACDMPFLNPAVVRLLVERCEGYDVVVPSVGGEPQPLHAVYSKSCIPFIERLIGAGGFRIVDFYPRVSVLRLEDSAWREADPDNRGFYSVNTPEEFREAESWLQPRCGEVPGAGAGGQKG